MYYGEDSNGRRISLLNCEPSAISNTPATTPVLRPPSSHRSTGTTAEALSSLSLARKYHQPPPPSRPREHSAASASLSLVPPLVRHDTLAPSQPNSSPMTPENYPDLMDRQPGQSSPYYGDPRSAQQTLFQPLLGLQEAGGQPHYHFQNADFIVNDPYNSFAQPGLPLHTQFDFQTPESSTSGLSPTTISASPITPSTSKATTTAHPTSAGTSAAAQATGTPPPGDSSSSSKPVKKKYPCPFAKQHQCADTFTTSGHAARHGKKHTGEKSVICPTCKKGFTRKDNMKQHERTHKNNNGKDSAGGSAPRIQPNRQNGSDSQSPPLLESLTTSANETNGFNSSPHLTLDRAEVLNGFPNGAHHPSHRLRLSSEEDGEGESPRLDALAAAVDYVGPMASHSR